MYGFLAGFSSPESIFAEKKILISCFVTKTGNMLFFPKISLFHINCYFIGKVSPMYGFQAGFSSPESIFAEKNNYFLFCNQNRKYVIFSQNRIISHYNCYFIGKVSPMYGFLAGLVLRNTFLLKKILISCFVTKTGNMLFFPKNRK